MRVRLLKEETVLNFALKHANVESHFQAWLEKIDYADWAEPLDISNTFNSNLIGDNRVVFDIGGNGRNACRIISEFSFGRKFVHLYINWIGTHEAYNNLSNNDKRIIDIGY